MKKILVAAVFAAAVMATPPAANASVLYGLGNTRLSAAQNASNLYTVDTATGAAALVGQTGQNLRGLVVDPTTGRAYASGAANGGPGRLYEVNLQTGSASLIGGSPGLNFSELVFDGSGNLFGYTARRNNNNSFYDYYSIDPANGNATRISNSPNWGAQWSVAYSVPNDEVLYLDGFGLGTIDLSDGRLTRTVVSPSPPSGSPQFAADQDGSLYFVDRSMTTSLWTIDETTGQRRRIGSNANGVGLNSLAFANSVVQSAIPEPTMFITWAGLACCGTLAAKRRR